MEVESVKYGLVLGVSAAAFILSLLNAVGDGGGLERLGDWLSKIIRRRRGWDECPRLHAARKFLGAKLLAGGYGKHHAYYIAGDGRVLVADAVDFYLALFAGVEDFWHVGDGGRVQAGSCRCSGKSLRMRQRQRWHQR